MTKFDAVKAVSFGQRVAEDERDNLATYFVETEQWRKVWSGEVDIVFAPKGGGKSAIYSMVVSRENELFDRSILIAPGENPTGATAFTEVEEDPPTTETEFVSIWKLYFLVLIANLLSEYDIRSEPADKLISNLKDAGLLTAEVNKRSIVRRVIDYVRSVLPVAKTAEATLTLDPTTGLPTGIVGKITLAEPTAPQLAAGYTALDSLFELADSALQRAGFTTWLMLDRLDVAFASSHELEENALRALFRAYRDLQSLNHIELKIFLRSDIWKSITASGFREASHITKELNLDWNSASLLQLLLRRMVQSATLCDYYSVDPVSVLGSTEMQKELFDKVFPEQIELGPRKSKTFDWCLARTRDGSETNAPRELIHLFAATKDEQTKRFERGEVAPPATSIFDRQAFKDALPTVSETRLTKTLYAEYPALRTSLEALSGQKTHQDLANLESIWGLTAEETAITASRLVEIGFFERRGDRANPTFWVPFMYRPALGMVQGSVEGISGSQDEEDEPAA